MRRQDEGNPTRVSTVRAVESGTKADQPAAPRQVLDSNDSRYKQFMKALEALRVNTGDDQVDETRIAELAEQAPQVYVLFDGKPTPVQPAGDQAERPDPAFMEQTDQAA